MFKRVPATSMIGLLVCVALSAAGCSMSDESIGQAAEASKIYGQGLDCPNEPWPVCEPGVHDFCHYWDGVSYDGWPPPELRAVCAYILCAEGRIPIHDCPGFEPPDEPGPGGGGGGGDPGAQVPEWDLRRELRPGQCSTLVGPRRCCPATPYPEGLVEWTTAIVFGRGDNCRISGNGASSKVVESGFKIAGIEPIGKGLSRRVLAKLARNAAARGAVSKIEGAKDIVADVVQLTHRTRVPTTDVLGAARRYVGDGYIEIRPGTFNSVLRPVQFRMADPSDLLAHGKIGPHVHFIRLDRIGGVPIKNLHVPFKN